MREIENKTLQTFLDNLIEQLKSENDDREWDNQHEDSKIPIFDVPFLISSLWQSFRTEPNTYSDFVKCLNHTFYQIHIVQSDDDYFGICKAIVTFYDSKEVKDFHYEIDFIYNQRDYGYCQCTPDMEDYREDKHCCGHGCDWWAPSFEIRKSYRINIQSWDGDEHDYWDFEDEFYMNDKELAEKKEKEDKEREILELKNRIEEDQKRLAELEGA